MEVLSGILTVVDQIGIRPNGCRPSGNKPINRKPLLTFWPWKPSNTIHDLRLQNSCYPLRSAAFNLVSW